jgi:hypothetical protein
MNRLKYDKIPIWENKWRIKHLQFFRIVYLVGMWGYTELLKPGGATLQSRNVAAKQTAGSRA